MHILHKRALHPVLVYSFLCLLLSSCSALEPTHSDGLTLPDSTNSYYGATRADAGKNHYLSLWRTGDLAGACEQDKQSQDSTVSDSVFVEMTESFDEKSGELSATGRSRLDQILKRIDQYHGITGIEVHSPTRRLTYTGWDRDESRSGAISSYLRSHIDDSTLVHVIDNRRSSKLKSQSERIRQSYPDRFFVRILARAAKHDASTMTLCGPTAENALPMPSTVPDSHEVVADTVHKRVFDGPLMLSAGDRVRIRVPEDTDIQGIYEIDANGNIDLPYTKSIRAAGLRVDELEKRVTKLLVDGCIIRHGFAAVDISVLQWSAADVFVSGAVFNPGRKTINGLSIELKAFKQTQSSGDAARERFLSNALVSAGGVRPDADLSSIEVKRQGETITVDLEGILNGTSVNDISLITGDEIVVPSTGLFRKELAKVSQITPQGIRLFVSNLTTPRIPSQVDTDATKLPYGTRLLHVLLSANCVGGTQLTNSAKKALLITVNPVTQVTEAIERDIQQLVGNPDRDHVNPFLMPNDGVACYDSDTTNYRDFARTVTDILSPFSLLKSLTGY